MLFAMLFAMPFARLGGRAITMLLGALSA